MTFSSRDDEAPIQHRNGVNHGDWPYTTEEAGHATGQLDTMHPLKALAEWASEHVEIVGFGAGSCVIFLVILVVG